MVARTTVVSVRSPAHRLLWLALLLALCNAFLPTALRIVAAEQGEQVVSLCSSFGVKQFPLDSTGQPKPPSQASSDCNYCLASQLSCLPVAKHFGLAPVVLVSSTLSDAASTGFVTPPHRSAAQPRAPPVFS